MNNRHGCVTFETISAVGADKVTGRAFWANRPMDLPLTNMNTDACATLNCPMEAGRRQTYTYSLPVSRSFPNVSVNHTLTYLSTR
jgi:Niemann-Pick C2 protein